MTSPFNWNTGAPSILYCKSAHTIAQKNALQSGKALDRSGRAVIDLAPHSKQSISIGTKADSDKRSAICRGGI